MPAPRKKRAIQRVFSTEEALNEIFHDDDSNDDDFEDMEVSDVEDEQLALPVHGHDDDIGKLTLYFFESNRKWNMYLSSEIVCDCISWFTHMYYFVVSWSWCG